jgi:hypothetical protein
MSKVMGCKIAFAKPVLYDLLKNKMTGIAMASKPSLGKFNFEICRRHHLF